MEQFQEKLKEFVGHTPLPGVHRRRYFRSNSGIACESDVLVFGVRLELERNLVIHGYLSIVIWFSCAAFWDIFWNVLC